MHESITLDQNPNNVNASHSASSSKNIDTQIFSHGSIHSSHYTNHRRNDSPRPFCLNPTDLSFRSKGLHFCNLNVRHLLPSIDELKTVMSTDKCPDILGLCETFLGPNVHDAQLKLNGFDFIRKDRSETQNKTGGGVILYFRNTLNVRRRPDIEISNIETVWTEISLSNSKPFLLCTVYRPPNCHTEWIDLFEDEISVAQTSGLEFILMGDFNIDFAPCTNTKWLNLIQLFDLRQLVIEPTRVTPTTATIIDHVYSSHPENIIECFTSTFSISDHYPICFTRKVNCKIPKTDHITSTYRSFKHFDESLFLNDLEMDIASFTTTHSSLDEDFSSWYSIIMSNLDKHAPMKCKRVKTKRLPDWFTPEITQLQKLRDQSKRLKMWSDYKRYRNQVKYLIRKAKRNFFSVSVTKSKDSKFIWKHLRASTNKAQAASNKLPSELNFDGEIVTDSEVIATKLNSYFSSISKIINEHRDDTETIDADKLKSYVNSKVPENISFRIPLISTEKVKSYILKLDPTKATGIDGLGPKIIKLAAHALAPSIAMLMNKSILTGSFPSQLKQAKVFPIHKGGDKADPSNYRPISILPTVSKFFEKHINHHLMAFLNKYKLIHENQSGFRQKHSCQTALVKLVDQWLSCIDKGDVIGTLFVDFRKAFDLVDHSILLEKLSLYRLNPITLKWFKSYLSSRQQAISCDTGLTEFSHVISGVPQGSILGPTLFLLFINDLPLFLNYCFADFFADDATFHTHNKNIDTVENHIVDDFGKTKQWSKRNNLPINYSKTTCMTAGTKKRLALSRKLEIKVDGICIENVSKQKLMGIYIDENLNWSAHIDYLCSNISSKISLLRQLSQYVPQHVQKLFYQSYIMPLIDYGSVVWGSTSTYNLDRILKLQKRAARIILKADFLTRSEGMFAELGWQPVEKRIMYNKAVLIYKALNNLTPEYLSKLLTPVSQTHGLNLRSSKKGNLHVPRSGTALYSEAFSCSAPKLWNNLPQSVKDCDTLNSFKRILKATM